MQGGKLMKDGQPFKFAIMLDVGNPTRKDFALVSQQTFQKLGMDVSIDSQEFNKWYDRSSKGDYDMYVSYWITPADPDALYNGYSDDNSDKYKNPAVDDLFAQGKVTTVAGRPQADLREVAADAVRRSAGRLHDLPAGIPGLQQAAPGICRPSASATRCTTRTSGR